MNSLKRQTFLPRELVYEMLTKENDYAKGWEKDKESQKPPFPDHTVNRTSGEPFSMMDWIVFAEKYLKDAKEGYANYCPDLRVIRIRMLKAASLLVTALQVHGEETDLEDIAGVSSNKFPALRGGLETFKEMKAAGASAPSPLSK